MHHRQDLSFRLGSTRRPPTRVEISTGHLTIVAEQPSRQTSWLDFAMRQAMRQAILHCESLVQCCTSKDPGPRADKVHLTGRYQRARREVCTRCDQEHSAREACGTLLIVVRSQSVFRGRPLRHGKISSIAVHRKARSGIPPHTKASNASRTKLNANRASFAHHPSAPLSPTDRLKRQVS